MFRRDCILNYENKIKIRCKIVKFEFKNLIFNTV